MIGYLKGKVLESNPGHWTIGVGADATGYVGYSIQVPSHAEYDFAVGLDKSAPVELYIYTHVREDAFDLFGFKTKFEKELFTTLLTVNGVGPKSAMTILSSAGTDTLVNAIVSGDQLALTKVPGIGKKTAERLVVELRDTLRKRLETGTLRRSPNTQAEAAAAEILTKTNATIAGFTEEMRDAREALMGLGVKETDAYQLLQSLAKKYEDSAQWNAQRWIKSALSELSHGSRN